MKTLCCLVSISEMRSISKAAYLISDFNGNSDIFPKSTVFGVDRFSTRSTKVWIAEWILKKKSLCYSNKKSAFINDNGKIIPTVIVKYHEPDDVVFHNIDINKDLLR